MTSAFSDSVFSVPLGHLADPRVGGEQVAQAAPLTGLARFIGDGANQAVRFLAEREPWPESCWPLVLYGPTGTGKTTLGMAVLHRYLTGASTGSGWGPEFLPASDLVRRYRAAVETDSISEWRKRWAGGLMIDNLQYLEGHDGAQQELLYLLDQLAGTGRPLIVTLDRDPAEAAFLVPSLRSRLVAGLTIPVALPGMAARQVLVRELASVHRLPLEPDAVDWLAQTVALTVPGLNHLLIQFKLSEGDGAGSIPRSQLQEWLAHSTQRSTDEKFRTVLRTVAREFGFRVSDLRGSSRKQTVTLARGVAMYLCRELLDVSYSRIGNALGRRDHSTVMHSCRKIAQMLDLERESARSKRIRRLHSELRERFNQVTSGAVENRSVMS